MNKINLAHLGKHVSIIGNSIINKITSAKYVESLSNGRTYSIVPGYRKHWPYSKAGMLWKLPDDPKNGQNLGPCFLLSKMYVPLF